MSFFTFGDLPTIQTRKALLILDFQNDFVRPSGNLHIPNTSEILETLPPLAAAFRKVGDVIWVRSQYESAQPTSDWNFGDRIILESGPPKKRPMPSLDKLEASSDRDSPEPIDREAFLSGQSAICCAAQTPGFQFPAPILASLDRDNDIVLDKTGYSALESNDLVLSFRTRFVTELYLCGSLSNVSVYATALDAVRNGFSVTLIEDCLGYRDFQRHREAMRRMADILGATGSTAQEITQELDWQETHAIARDPPAPSRQVPPVGIEGVLDSLDVQAEETAPNDVPDEEPLSLSKIVSQTRAQRVAAAAERSPVEGKKIRVRVRRPKHRESTPNVEVGSRGESSRPSENARQPVEDSIGEGDSRIVLNLDLPADAFKRIRDEVSWQKMYHLSGQVPRLVAVQGQIQPDGATPIYRHPADESPLLNAFTPAVDEVRVVVERILGHPLNHALIQLYRDGRDSISEHSDKTLDIVRGSYICNVSLGAQRVMVLRTKTSSAATTEGTELARTTQRIPLPHNSLFVLGPKTNMRWLHGIRPDRRPETTKSAEDLAFEGERISLTFRHIGTYVDPSANTIWGQGAVGKTQETARPIVHGHPEETERLIHAFGQENHASKFDWDAVYGGGFDVVNFVTTTPAQLTLSGDSVPDIRVQLALGESGLRYNIVDGNCIESKDGKPAKRPFYIDSHGTKVAGDLAILKHLAGRPLPATRSGVDVLQGGEHFVWIEELHARWRVHCSISAGELFESGLDQCENALNGHHYLGGGVLGIDDCSLWPILREIVQSQGLFDARFVNLNHYYHRVARRGIVKTILGGPR